MALIQNQKLTRKEPVPVTSWAGKLAYLVRAIKLIKELNNLKNPK